METATASSYRLKVRLGLHEFDADGPEEIVKDHYALFLQAASTAPASPQSAKNGSANGNGHVNGDTDIHSGEDMEYLWNRAYKRKDDQLSLHVLPPTKAVNADSILLILYGYHTLLNQESVKSTDLMDAAKQSGLRIDRIDRSIPAAYNVYVNKGGNGKGSRYTLNNRGLARAQELLEEMFE